MASNFRTWLDISMLTGTVTPGQSEPLGAMAMKSYFTFLKHPKPHNQMELHILSRPLIDCKDSLLLCRDGVSLFYSPSRLGYYVMVGQHQFAYV